MSSIRNDLTVHHFIQKLTGESGNIPLVTVIQENTFTSFWGAPIQIFGQKLVKMKRCKLLVILFCANDEVHGLAWFWTLVRFFLVTVNASNLYSSILTVSNIQGHLIQILVRRGMIHVGRLELLRRYQFQPLSEILSEYRIRKLNKLFI